MMCTATPPPPFRIVSDDPAILAIDPSGELAAGWNLEELQDLLRAYAVVGVVARIERDDGYVLQMRGPGARATEVFKGMVRHCRANAKRGGYSLVPPTPERPERDDDVVYDCEHRINPALWARDGEIIRCSWCGALGWQRFDPRVGAKRGPILTRRCTAWGCDQAALVIEDGNRRGGGNYMCAMHRRETA